MVAKRRTLPGAIPGLIRRCSPVYTPDGERAVVFDAEGPRFRVHTGVFIEQHPPGKMLLDVDEPTGQDHAMRFLAEHLGMAVLAEELQRGSGPDALVRAVKRTVGVVT